MVDPRKGLRAVFSFYARICLGVGLGLLAALLALRLFNWLLDWNTPFDPLDTLVFLTGLIVIAALLGPYVVTVGQLAHVLKMPSASIQASQPASQRQRLIILAAVGAVALVFGLILILSRSFTVWVAFGGGFVLMGLTLFYITWRIGQIEKAARMTIYQTDYSWRFDRTSYIGVMKK